MCPKYFEKLLHGHFFGTNRLVVFYSCCNVGCQQSSHQKQQYHPAPRASGSVLFFSQTLAAARMHTGRGQSCHFRGHCQISANAGWCGSAPYNHPDVSNQLDFSTFCTECGVSPSTTGNILWKCVNEKIRLIESSGDISNNNLHFPPNSSPDLLAHSTPLKESKATVNTKSFMSKFSL